MRRLGAGRSSRKSRGLSVSLGDDVMIKGKGLARIIKIESAEKRQYLVKYYRDRSTEVVSINQIIKE
jgi:hypothetical protein